MEVNGSLYNFHTFIRRFFCFHSLNLYQMQTQFMHSIYSHLKHKFIFHNRTTITKSDCGDLFTIFIHSDHVQLNDIWLKYWLISVRKIVTGVVKYRL